MNTFFFGFVKKNYIVKNSKISSSFIYKITCIIRKLIKNNNDIRRYYGYPGFSF